MYIKTSELLLSIHIYLIVLSSDMNSAAIATMMYSLCNSCHSISVIINYADSKSECSSMTTCNHDESWYDGTDDGYGLYL